MELRRHTLIDAQEATGKSERLFVGDLMNRIGIHAQIAGTATVKWYGSYLPDPDVDTAGDWVELDQLSASGLSYVDAPMGFVFAEVTAWTSGAVTVELLGNSFL